MLEYILQLFHYTGLLVWMMLILILAMYYPRSVDISKKGKIILVTGGASGIGLETVKLLDSAGCKVVVLDRNEDRLQDLAQKHPNVQTYAVDITKIEEIKNVYKNLESQNIQVWGIANIAGVWNAPGKNPREIKSCVEMDADTEIEPVIDINLLGAMRVNKIFFPMIKKSKGCILQVTSIAGRVSVLGTNTAYGISKQALITYMNYLRRELNHLGIRVICVEPGPVKTDLALNSMNDMTKLDFSKTQFEDLLRNSISPLHFFGVDSTKLWREPIQVASVIVDSLFTSYISNPHIIVDNIILKFGVTVVSFFPYLWQDLMLNGRIWRRNK